MKLQKRFRLALLLCGIVTVSFRASAQNPVTDWNYIAITSALAANQATAPGSNTQAGSILYLAYVHLAIYDAVNAIDHRFQSYGSDVPGSADASKEAAAVEAAYRMLVYLFPDLVGTLTTQYSASLAVIPDTAAKTSGMQIGQSAATLIIGLRTGDGRGAAVPYSFPSVPTPGVWIKTPPAFAAPAIPWLSKVVPFTMNSPSQFRPDPPFSLTSEEWAHDYNQVKALGAVNSTVRTPSQTEIGLFWTDSVGPQYSRAFRALAIGRNLDISDTARLFATLFTTGADALIGCWDAKYHYSFWRPVTAIPNGDIDGNPDTTKDPSWTPLLATPNHPEYPSAHSCQTGSYAAVLKDFFGTSKVTMVVNSTVTNTTHTFTNTKDWEKEVEFARIYAGFHYHNSVVQGVTLGKKVSDQVSRDFFQPLSKQESPH
jgi:hypothetical protein